MLAGAGRPPWPEEGHLPLRFPSAHPLGRSPASAQGCGAVGHAAANSYLLLLQSCLTQWSHIFL